MAQWLPKLFEAKRYFHDIGDGALLFRRRAQDEAPEESYPLVMLVDSTGRSAGPQNLDSMVIATVDFPPAQVRDDQMPVGEAVMALRGSFDDRLEGVFNSAKLSCRLVATQTGAGARSYFFLCQKLAPIERVLGEMRLPEGASFRFQTIADADEMLGGWLTPDRLEFAATKDDAVFRAIEERGDHRTTPRDARFYFYGGDLIALAKAATAEGFKTDPTSAANGLIIFKDMPVTDEALGEANQLFFQWVDEFGVDYDGWEAAMVVN